jgi:hypothetical protein
VALTPGFSIVTARRSAVAFVLFIAFMAALVVLGPTRAVSNADWMVLAASGDAEWRESAGTGAWLGLQTNGRLPDGAEVRTGASGTAVVARGLDRIEIRPGTSLVVAARGSTNAALEIDQTSGSATYTVEKRPAGTFSVHTPYVVAVVKGTKFDVDVTAQETGVSVAEGRVGVSDRRNGASVDVTPGQRARSSSAAAGIAVEATSSSSAVPGAAPNPNAKPNENAKAKATENSAAPGNSGSASGKGSAGGNSGGNAGGNSAGDAGGNAGGKGGGNAGGKVK